MKKLKQIIFLLTWLGVFMITGSLDCGEISPETAVIAAAINFIVMAWSGVSTGLLTVTDEERGSDKNEM